MQIYQFFNAECRIQPVILKITTQTNKQTKKFGSGYLLCVEACVGPNILKFKQNKFGLV
jgi:hypothetical protein